LGHTVTIFANEGSKASKHGMLVTTGPDISTVNVNWYKEEENRYFKWKDIVTNDRYDVICGHDWFGFEYFHKMNNLKLKVAHVHHGGYVWDTAPPFPKPNLIAISKFMRDYTIVYFKQKGFNVDCRFVHNGINLDRYSFDPLVEKTNRLLYVGRFSAFKQPNMAIRIAAKLGLPLDLIGGSFVEDPNYMQQIEKMCDGENVVIYKDATHEFKIKKMQEAKAVIIPSKMNEPLNLVSIEAQACGTAVIVTRDGGLPETVNHGVTGFICNTEQEMEEAIEKIDTIKSSNCRKHVEENFSRQKMAKEYEKLFYQIVKGEDW
jgi:glycosyltransferase involved in cell wall biosynthesis